MNKPVIIIGGGGHAKVLLEILRIMSIKVIGVTEKEQGNCKIDLPFLGQDEIIFSYLPEELLLVNGIGSTGDNNIRKKVYDRFTSVGYEFMTLVHPSAIIAKDVVLNKGVQVMAGGIIQPGSFIGENTIINTKASIDHDCIVGKNIHIAPGVTISGNVRIAEDVHIGTGATIIQNVSIDKSSIVGAGSVVTKDIGSRKTVVGVPAKEV